VMHASAEVEVAALEQGPEPAKVNAGGFPFADDLVGEVLGRVAVEENEDPDLPCGGAEQRGRDELAGLVAVKDISLEMDGVRCFVNQLNQRREVVGAAVDETDFVVVCISCEQSGRSSCRHGSLSSELVKVGIF